MKWIKSHKLLIYPICTIIITLVNIFIVDLINNHITHTYNQFWSIIYHIIINNDVIQWSNAIGSLSAASIALFVAWYSNRKIPPFLKYERYYDPQRGSLIIQFINDSKTTDFIQLNQISFLVINTNNITIIPQEIPNELRKYEWFHTIKGHQPLTINMKFSIIKHLLTCLIKNNNDQAIIFQFKELYSNKIIFIQFSRKQLHDDTLKFKESENHK